MRIVHAQTRSRQLIPRSTRLAAALILTAVGVWFSARADAQSNRIAGTVTYTGKHGPVSSARTLCICRYSDAALKHIRDCYEIDSSPGTYSIGGLDTNAYYLIAFVDF